MVNNLLRIFPHILFNPIHHQPNKNIRIDAGNKILIFITNGYVNAFFLDNTKNQIVNQRIQIFLNLLFMNAAINIRLNELFQDYCCDGNSKNV